MPLQIVLAATTLVMVADLIERGLAHVGKGGTTEMLRMNLLATHRPLARRPWAGPRPGAGDRQGARGLGRGCRRARPPTPWRSSSPAPIWSWPDCRRCIVPNLLVFRHGLGLDSCRRYGPRMQRFAQRVQCYFTPKGASAGHDRGLVWHSLAGDGGGPDVTPAALPCRAKLYDLSGRCRALRPIRESLSV